MGGDSPKMKCRNPPPSSLPYPIFSPLSAKAMCIKVDLHTSSWEGWLDTQARVPWKKSTVSRSSYVDQAGLAELKMAPVWLGGLSWVTSWRNLAITLVLEASQVVTKFLTMKHREETVFSFRSVECGCSGHCFSHCPVLGKLPPGGGSEGAKTVLVSLMWLGQKKELFLTDHSFRGFGRWKER